MVKDRFDLQVGNYNSLFYILIFLKLMSCLLIVLHTSLPLSTRIIWVDVLLCVFFFSLRILVEKQLYKNQSGGSAVISPRRCLFSQRGVAAVWSAHGCRGDECVLAFAGISAGRGSLHSDVKGSTQRQAVFFRGELWNRPLGCWTRRDSSVGGWCGISLSVVRQSHAAGALVMLSEFEWLEAHRGILATSVLIEAAKSP